MSSLTLGFAEKWKKEKNITVSTDIYDDIVDTIPYKKIAKKNREGTMVIAALVGVQSNQFPRASDIARKLTALGVKTVIGGFHVSGILALFDKPSPELQELNDSGIILVEGEAETIWENIVSDIVEGKEKLLYRKTSLPDISDAPIPQMERKYLKKFARPNMATIDCSRGCPFNCSFCTIINVQGHKMRCRSAEKVLAVIRENVKYGIKYYFFTDDNFSRNPAWEPIFDGIIHMNEVEGLHIEFMIQVDTRCHKIPNFVQKAGRAGCTQAFIGMESLNPKNLAAVSKKQNNVDDYADYIQAWHDAGVMTHVGYIIGFPYDTPESVREDINNLKDNIKVDQASFFILTPLPGSMDHYSMVQNGEYMHSDLDKFDSFHVVMNHPTMSSEEWYNAYQEAWESFYEIEHLKKVLIRAGRKAYWNIFKNIMWYKNSLLEPRHPMVSGFVRLKNRTDIRTGVKQMSYFEHKRIRIREMVYGFIKRIGLFFEFQELWWLTRKPDDPKFKFVVDFTSILSDAKLKLSSINFNDSYTKWCDDVSTIIVNLKTKIIISQQDTSKLKGKAKIRLNRLIDDMVSYLDMVHVSDHYNRGLACLTTYLNTNIHHVEEFTLKNVAARRRITNYWLLTFNRIRTGKIVRFVVSIPKIVVIGIRDFTMSLLFAYHLFTNKI
jgi:radical SAM superfamily enzyme YgiQ (UPF0313 family)